MTLSYQELCVVCFMHDTKTGILPFNSNIDKTERALRKAAWIAKEMTKQKESILIQDYSSDESDMRDENPHITLENYEPG